MAERSGAAERVPESKSAKRDDGSDGEQSTSATEVRTAFISGNTFHAKAVQYVVVDGEAMLEGDIVLGPADQVEAASDALKAELRGEVALGVIITGSQFRWPGCTVPFDIDPALPNQSRVTDAIAHWEANTQFSFVLRTPANAASHPDWVTFRPSGGCSSSVGRRGGQQFVNLGSGCTLGNTIHEIGHAVGMWHEQSREDRDAFVTINWANIQAGFEHNFNQHISDGDDIGPYDYGSIMHYPRAAFGVGGAETITPTDPSAVIGQRTALSPGDISTANSMCPKGFETIKEPIETVKEQFPETVKEQSPETIKERAPETIKEQSPETIKEQLPETIKEQSPETIKEQLPETIKERIPETVKEQIPETVKEQIETIVEGIETQVETVQPGIGPGVINPAVAGGGGVPFALRTPHVGQADLGGQATEARLAAVEQALLGISENQAVLAERLAALLAELGGAVIVVISHDADAHARQVLARLAGLGQQTLLFDIADFPHRATLSIDFADGSSPRVRVRHATGGVSDLTDATAVWWRRPQFVDVGSILDDDARGFTFGEWNEALKGVNQLLTCPWMNPPANDEAASRKAFQLGVAHSLGFTVPATLMTSDAGEARTFIEGHGVGRTIYKIFSATHQVWRETRLVRAEDLASLDALALAPVIFQEYIPAVADIRVTIVGDEVFAMSIDTRGTSYEVDFRVSLAEARTGPCPLPEPVDAALRLLMKRLGLAYGAVDLRLTPEGDYVFLEINPAGEFLFAEHGAALPITDAVAAWLASPTPA